MGAISYERAPLTVLRISDSSAEEALEFLNRYSPRGYEHVPDYAPGSSVIYIRSRSDQSTTVGLLPDTVLVHDPDRGGVDLVYSHATLNRLGISKRKLLEAFAEAEERAAGVADASPGA